MENMFRDPSLKKISGHSGQVENVRKVYSYLFTFNINVFECIQLNVMHGCHNNEVN